MEMKRITQKEAEEISEWHYEGEYSFYDMKADPEDYEEFIHEETRSPYTYSVYESDDLMGFFSVYKGEDETISIGLGMHPEWTGKGLGESFIREGLDALSKELTFSKISLAVAVFNKRAIAVYERAGFVPVHTYQQKTNGASYTFLKMEKVVK
ncbi:GNAT family N-acetyltransferase [Halobacillus campisalis]|uniref:GNAT family N-acetyltransferase n=1 Tax=Halobacillus campisalis TaxID=435909 RepID=A0ABW2JZU7_9BACI|nr:GNAT family N-acetyltransferase [Halobacillus campisalis]